MELELREYNSNDLKGCAEELVLAFKGYPWNEDWTVKQAMDRISEIMDSRVARGFVAIDKDTNKVCGILIGRIMTMLDYKEFWVDDFSISPEFQHHGIGKKLMEYSKGKIKEEFNTAKYFILITRKGYPCYDFYIKNGFEYESKNTYLSIKL